MPQLGDAFSGRLAVSVFVERRGPVSSFEEAIDGRSKTSRNIANAQARSTSRKSPPAVIDDVSNNGEDRDDNQDRGGHGSTMAVRPRTCQLSSPKPMDGRSTDRHEHRIVPPRVSALGRPRHGAVDRGGGRCSVREWPVLADRVRVGVARRRAAARPRCRSLGRGSESGCSTSRMGRRSTAPRGTPR